MTTEQHTDPNYHITIVPASGWPSLRLAELWEYHELLYFMIWRDVKVRYKQTLLGAAWAVIQPFATMLIFSVFFGGLAGIPSDGVPYPLFSYAALVPWTFFASGLNQSANGLVTSSQLIKKIYFPRLVIPVANVLTGLVDFLFAFALLLGMLLFYRIPLTVNLLWLPVFMLLATITCLGAGLWLAALNVQYRDVRHLLPFLTQFLLFASPIAYPSSLIQDDTLRFLYGLNPMTGVIEGFRWALLGLNTDPLPTVLLSTGVAVLLLVSGLLFFRRMERNFADVV